MTSKRARTRRSFVYFGLAAVAAFAGWNTWSSMTSQTPSPAVEDVVKATETAAPVAAPEQVAVQETAPVTPDLPPATQAATSRPAPTTAPTTQSVIPSEQMAEALNKLTRGELLQAREMLNEGLIANQFGKQDEQAARKMIAEINKTLVFSPRRIAGDPWMEQYTVQPGDMLQRITPKYELTAKFVQRINGITDARKMRAGHTLKLVKGPFHAVVRKSDFVIDMYLGAPGGAGSMYVCSFPVGLGQDDSTPLGTWQAEAGKKLTNPTYYDPRGGMVLEADDPQNPLGEYWIGLTGISGNAVGKLSYGIHGTIEPESVGKMSSMGCIRLLAPDIEQVYEMLIDGKSTVIVAP